MLSVHPPKRIELDQKLHLTQSATQAAGATEIDETTGLAGATRKR